jgi:hypothetical protein
MWYALLGIYGQERPSQESAKFDFCHPLGGGTIIDGPQTQANKYFYITYKMCFFYKDSSDS